jgi:hypothetical protein
LWHRTIVSLRAKPASTTVRRPPRPEDSGASRAHP